VQKYTISLDLTQHAPYAPSGSCLAPVQAMARTKLLGRRLMRVGGRGNFHQRQQDVPGAEQFMHEMTSFYPSFAL
jgi:hypothetical protein